MEDALSHMQRMARVNTNTLYNGLRGIEGLLTEEYAPGTIARLVAVDANYVLDDLSDDGARVWLRQVADMIRSVLGQPSS